MVVDRFGGLIIPRSTVESIGKQEIGELMIGFTWRKNVWKQPYKLIQAGSIQLIGAAIIFAAMMIPVDRGLSIYRSPPSQSDRLAQLIWVDGTMTAVILGGINSWIYRRGKRLQRLLKLVEQIEQYNLIVASIATLERVANLTNHQCETAQVDSMMEILSQTRQNLLTALEIDRYLRQYPNSSELTISNSLLSASAIAHNLINLQNLAQQPQLAEYGTLLTQAWEIEMSVYEERAFIDKITQ